MEALKVVGHHKGMSKDELLEEIKKNREMLLAVRLANQEQEAIAIQSASNPEM